MKHFKISLVAALMLSVAMCGCKIQNVSGPYQIAQERIKIQDLKPTEDDREIVAPMPEQIVRETEQKLEAVETKSVSEPQIVAPVISDPEDTEAIAEKFDIVDGQGNVNLKKYHVVIGSFGNKDNALRLQKQMRPQYDPVLVVNERGMYRVLMISYETYKDAKTKKQEIKWQFPDAWVLIQKK